MNGLFGGNSRYYYIMGAKGSINLRHFGTLRRAQGVARLLYPECNQVIAGLVELNIAAIAGAEVQGKLHHGIGCYRTLIFGRRFGNNILVAALYNSGYAYA
jgi:hypothetical protein